MSINRPTRLATTICLGFLLLAGTAGGQPGGATLTIPAEPPGGTAYQRIKKLLPPHVGCAVMVLGQTPDGEPVEFKRGFGVQRLKANESGLADTVTPATNFRVASFTKVLTAAAVLRLADQGELSLDDPLTKWLPAMPASYEAASIRSLLDHTSGLPKYHRLLNEAQTRDCSDVMVLRTLAQAPNPDFTPGARCEYSNSAYVLLGLVVQQASGRPFHEYLRDEVLCPAGMAGSTLLVEGLNSVADRAYGHLPGLDRRTQALQRQLDRMVQLRDRVRLQGANQMQAFELQIANLQRQLGDAPPPNANWHEEDQNGFSRLGGDGALYTSLEDLQALFTAIEKRSLPLSERSHDLWMKPRTTPMAADGFGDAARGRRYACGWMVDEELGEPRYSHRGATRGFRQTIQWMPESGRAVVVLMNSVPPGPEGPTGWDDAFMQRLGENCLRAVLEPIDEATELEALAEPTELRRKL